MINPIEKSPDHKQERQPCYKCQGSGAVKIFDEKGNPNGTKPCPQCGGSGKA